MIRRKRRFSNHQWNRKNKLSPKFSLSCQRLKLAHFLKAKVSFLLLQRTILRQLKNGPSFVMDLPTHSVHGSFLWLSLCYSPETGDMRVRKQSSCPRGADIPVDEQLLYPNEQLASQSFYSLSLCEVAFFGGNLKTWTQWRKLVTQGN